MKHQKIVFLLGTFLFLGSPFLVAQIDNKKKGTSIAIKATTAIKKPQSLTIDTTKGFKNTQKNTQKTTAQIENELKNKGIKSQAKLNEERFLKSFQKINGQYQYPKIDQNLGNFRSNSKYVSILCRDYQHPDGDRVTIYINDIPVIYNIVLRQAYQKFKIPLVTGVNKIAFKALNQGTSGPNTAGFKVYDDTGSIISSNEWNLATGAIATLLIVKDK
ncbi:MAG: hypothetical protein P8K77_02600 [Polaribacter sp.]|nr:hypothetical protein [Polaribacter sp.]